MSAAPASPTADRKRLEDAFRLITRMRVFEEIVGQAHESGDLPGLLHLAIGAEATTAGVLSALGPADRVYCAHRPHAQFLGCGVDARALFAELAGRSTGICKGRAGSMHLMSDRAVLATGIVGGSLSVAVGHAAALEGDAVVAVFFGDGAVQAGAFHESLNLASLWGVRVLFVCENNGRAEFSTREEHTTVGAVTDYGDLFRLPYEAVDGADYDAVSAAAERLRGEIVLGEQPALLECHISRLRPHYEGDRRRGQIDEDPMDPVARLTERLLGLGTDTAWIEEVRSEQWAELRAALDLALADPPPRADDDEALVYARSAG